MRSCRSYYDYDEKEEREKGRRGKKLGCVVKAKDKRTKEEEKWITTVMTRLPSIVFMMTTMTTMILMMTKKAKKEGEANVGKNNSQAGLLVTAHNFQQRFPASSSSLAILLIFFRKPFLTKVLHQVFILLPQWKIGVVLPSPPGHLGQVPPTPPPPTTTTPATATATATDTISSNLFTGFNLFLFSQLGGARKFG